MYVTHKVHIKHSAFTSRLCTVNINGFNTVLVHIISYNDCTHTGFRTEILAGGGGTEQGQICESGGLYLPRIAHTLLKLVMYIVSIVV